MARLDTSRSPRKPKPRPAPQKPTSTAKPSAKPSAIITDYASL